MHIDPFTIVVFNIFVSLTMCICLFVVSRGHLTDVNGIRYWATAVLLQCISWILLALIEFIPKFFSVTVGITAFFLGLVFYIHGLAAFKERCITMRWLYLIIAMGVIGNSYFVFIDFNTAAKITVTSVTMAILLFTSSFLLFSKLDGVLPVSHRLTGGIFAFTGFITLARACYYLLWNTQADQGIFNVNSVQDMFYLTSTFLLIGTSVGFTLMCNDKYIIQQKQTQSALQDTLDRLQKSEQQRLILSVAVEQSPASIMISDINANLLYVNPKFTEITGYSAEEVIGKNSRMLQSGLNSKVFYQQLKESLKRGELWQGELINRRKNGEIYWEEAHIAPIRNALGAITHYVGVKLDITERKQMEEKLRASELRLRTIIESEPECIKIVDEEGRLTQMNPAGLAMIEADSFEQVMGCVVLDVVAPEHRLAFAEMHNRVIAGERQQLEFEIIGLKGGRHWMETHAVPLLEDGKRVQLAITRDITERKAIEEEIKQLAFFDPLTGLPNRRKLLDRLEYAIALNHRMNSQFAVFMMDLDKFKAVNDKLGHAAGDELLKQVATRITHCLRDSDMVARLGGDEFVLVLENLKVLEDAETIALKLIADLTVPFQLSDNNTVQIGASIGISIYPLHGNTPETLMDHADTALYQAKECGRGCFVHFSEASSASVAQN